MKRLFAAALLAGTVMSGAAHATMLDGYVALCSAVGTGTCTEFTVTGYARQAVSFSDPVNGASSNLSPIYFGAPGVGTFPGRAIYDAPTGGNLVAVVPVAAPVTQTAQNFVDAGGIKITVSVLTGYPSAKIYSGTIPASGVIGTSSDGSTVTAGVKDVIRSGYLTAALPSFDASYVGPVTQTTGFSVALTNQATYVVHGAGTLATGTVTLPSTPADGQSFRIGCDVTVTALTVTAASGQTLSGAVSTCSANAGHEWFYAGGTAKTWYLLF